MAKDAKGHGSDAKGGAAHAQGVNAAVESHQSSELRLFANNDANLYRQSFQPVVSNLGNKMDKGAYDPEKAKTLWGYHADRAAQSYAKQMGGGQPWHQMFPPAVRREAAAHWEQEEAPRIRNGEHKG